MRVSPVTENRPTLKTAGSAWDVWWHVAVEDKGSLTESRDRPCNPTLLCMSAVPPGKPPSAQF